MDKRDEELLRSVRLVIDPVAQVLVCARPECLIGLSPKPEQVNSHLKRKYDMLNDLRSRVVRLLRHRTPTLQDPPNAPLRPHRLQPDPYLWKFEGFACKFYDY